MNPTLTRQHLNIEQISQYDSPYLTTGRKHETWQINSIEIEHNHLIADISMCSTYVSATDNNKFHLTIFSALEFLSQLMIIYAHVWAGLGKKSREGWMVESHTRSIRAVRNPEHIKVEMNVRRMHQRGFNLYCQADYRVTDDQDGLFEVELKGFLS